MQLVHGANKTCMAMMEKRRLACRFFEIVLLATIIIAIWVAMFLPVAVYFVVSDNCVSTIVFSMRVHMYSSMMPC